MVASVGRVSGMKARQTRKVVGVLFVGHLLRVFGGLCGGVERKKQALTSKQKLERRVSKTEAEDGGSNRRSETSNNAVEVVENKHGLGHVRGSESGSGIGDRRVLGRFSIFDFRGLPGRAQCRCGM